MEEKRDQLIETILDKTDLVELVSEVTKLEKKGKNHFGLCPFHHEKTPSFSVNEDKRFYHCFSCKASGNAITFVKETQQVSGGEAVRILAERAGIDIGERRQSPNQKYHDINRDASTFYHVALTHTKGGAEALSYLTNRDIDKTLIERFDIGYAPKGPDALYKALDKKDVLTSDMVDLGLVRDGERVRDVFRERVMFPLHDELGNVVGFSGRTHKPNDKTAKYMNSPQTPVFEKNKVLYNLHRAKKAIKDADRVVVFEGFMDVLAAAKADITEAVGIMGTALTEHHIARLKALTKRVILCFDGDTAGRDATRKYLHDFERAGFTVYVALVPEGLDPDDYVRKRGAKQLKSLIDNAIDGREHIYNDYKASLDVSKITDAERFKKLVFDMVAPLSNVQKNHYLSMLARDLKVSLDVLEQDFNERKRAHLTTYKRPQPKIEITDKFRKAERGFIRYFLYDPHFVRRFKSAFKTLMFSDKDAREVQLEIMQYYDQEAHAQTRLVPRLFIENLKPTLKSYVEKHVMVKDYPYDENEFDDYLKTVRELNRRNEKARLKNKKSHAKTREERIEIQRQIDRLIKEDAKHGQRKNPARAR